MEKSATREAFSRRVWLAIGITALAVAGGFFVWRSLGVLLLVFAAAMLAMALRGLGRLVGRVTQLPDRAAVGVAIALVLAVALGGAFLAGRTIAEQAGVLVATLPAKIDHVRDRAAASPIGASLLPASGRDVMGRVEGVFSTTLGVLGDLLVVVFLGIYFAIDGRRYRDGLIRLLPQRRRPRAEQVSDAVARLLHGWMLGQLVAMAIIGVSVTVLLTALGVPMPLLFGVLAGLLNFIPYVGPPIAIVPPALFALSESPEKAAWLVGIYLVIQVLESYVITPLIQKRAVHMPPALILVSELLLGLWAGALGIVLATPLAVVALVLIRKLWKEDALGERESVPHTRSV